jgi:zinc transport system ATP-binding protein
MTDPAVISLRQASFGYGDVEVVSRVDVAVRPGDIVALLGPNGSGKSTLVKGILGLDEHLGGDIELFGVPRDHFRDFTRIGYVPQRHSLSASVRATAAEIVEVGRLPHRPWWRPLSREDRRIVQQSLEVVGLGERAGEDVSTFSGGQQRRVLIARALASQPDVLIMDEPTAGVDAGSQRVLVDVLHRLAARGTTMVIVTHELEALEDLVTRVVCLSGGRVDFDGPATAYAAHCGVHSPGDDHHPNLAPEQPGPGHDTGVTGPLDAPRSEEAVHRA